MLYTIKLSMHSYVGILQMMVLLHIQGCNNTYRPDGYKRASRSQLLCKLNMMYLMTAYWKGTSMILPIW